MGVAVNLRPSRAGPFAQSLVFLTLIEGKGQNFPKTFKRFNWFIASFYFQQESGFLVGYGRTLFPNCQTCYRSELGDCVFVLQQDKYTSGHEAQYKMSYGQSGWVWLWIASLYHVRPEFGFRQTSSSDLNQTDRVIYKTWWRQGLKVFILSALSLGIGEDSWTKAGIRNVTRPVWIRSDSGIILSFGK